MSRTIAITGSSGFIGTPLVAALRQRGDRVVRLVRRASSSPDEVQWDPSSRHLDPAVLDGVDAVINLAGAGIADKRWTDERKEEILSSRVDATTAVAEAIAATGRPVRLVSGSAIGFYGSRGDEILTESSSPGEGFTTDVCLAWEGAAEPAVAAGAPVAYARTGLVLDPQGGALERMLPLAKLGLGGPLGSGSQWWPWITLRDEIAALSYLVDHPEVTGPVNLVGPNPLRQKDVASILGSVLGRPSVLPAPSLALRGVLGEFAAEVLDSHRVMPERLGDTDFEFADPDLRAALTRLLA